MTIRYADRCRSSLRMRLSCERRRLTACTLPQPHIPPARALPAARPLKRPTLKLLPQPCWPYQAAIEAFRQASPG